MRETTRFSAPRAVLCWLRMPLKLIIGPPNSGRTGVILDAFRGVFTQDPVLVVPTVDDVARFEEELTERGAVIGAAVGTFKDLFGLVARATDAPGGQPLSRIQRRLLAREAVGRSELRLLAASALPGGVPGCARRADLRAAGRAGRSRRPRRASRRSGRV